MLTETVTAKVVCRLHKASSSMSVDSLSRHCRLTFSRQSQLSKIGEASERGEEGDKLRGLRLWMLRLPATTWIGTALFLMRCSPPSVPFRAAIVSKFVPFSRDTSLAAFAYIAKLLPGLPFAAEEPDEEATVSNDGLRFVFYDIVLCYGVSGWYIICPSLKASRRMWKL